MDMRFLRKGILPLLMALAVLFAAALAEEPSPPREVHVAARGSDDAADGTLAAPFGTIDRAARAYPGATILVHAGSYGPVRLDRSCSGTAASPTRIRAAEGEAVVVRAGNGVGIQITDASHIEVEGLETVGGTHGIAVESTRAAGDRPMEGVVLRGCRVHGVRGVHGICVYGRNDRAPISDLRIEACEVWDCACGSSESLVVNGNVDGFRIVGNWIHDNDNIGIDMIGFEGTAAHPRAEPGRNAYEVDFARNGLCRDNVVYNISAEGNPAYSNGGAYDLCADGIYVDGGQDIEICHNFIFNCDIGLEVATEHSPDDNPLFRVTGVRAHDNVIAGCRGWVGLCFGGYEGNLGFTEGCVFDHNTLADNDAQIAVQRSRNNQITANLILGGEEGVVYNEDCAPEDRINEFRGNAAAELGDEDSWPEGCGDVYPDRALLAEGFRSRIDGVGSRFVPDARAQAVYEAQGR